MSSDKVDEAIEALKRARRAFPDSVEAGPDGSGYRWAWNECTGDEQEWVKGEALALLDTIERLRGPLMVRLDHTPESGMDDELFAIVYELSQCSLFMLDAHRESDLIVRARAAVAKVKSKEPRCAVCGNLFVVPHACPKKLDVGI
jgi:hypothetical protein